MTDKRPLTFDDFWRLRQVTDAQLSPNGKTVAYIVGNFAEEDGSGHSAIWLGDLATGTARRFTSGEAADTQPRWSPDGSRLAFVSTRHENKPQIFVIDLAGGEPERVTQAPEGATTPCWSPDGTSLCFSSAIPTEAQKVPQETAWLDAHSGLKDPPRMRRQSTLLSRLDGRGYIDRRIHLFVVDLNATGAEPRQLTDGDFDELEPAWSPDGRTIVFASNRREDREFSMGEGDLWLLDVESGLQMAAASPSTLPSRARARAFSTCRSTSCPALGGTPAASLLDSTGAAASVPSPTISSRPRSRRRGRPTAGPSFSSLPIEVTAPYTQSTWRARRSAGSTPVRALLPWFG
jgi:dipeptidyl aminopeptidase/acylaminoacyl peptidase